MNILPIDTPYTIMLVYVNIPYSAPVLLCSSGYLLYFCLFWHSTIPVSGSHYMCLWHSTVTETVSTYISTFFLIFYHIPLLVPIIYVYAIISYPDLRGRVYRGTTDSCTYSVRRASATPLQFPDHLDRRILPHVSGNSCPLWSFSACTPVQQGSVIDLNISFIDILAICFGIFVHFSHCLLTILHY